MNKLVAATIISLALTTIPGAEAPGAAKVPATALVGTWVMVSTKYGDATESSPPPENLKAMKFITPTHFIWAHFDPKTKKITNSMGGTYSLNGSTYTEKPEFAFEGMEEFVSKEQKFTAKIEGDKWIHSGELSNGVNLEEVWRRVKPDATAK
jgi:hypothetical protein